MKKSKRFILVMFIVMSIIMNLTSCSKFKGVLSETQSLERVKTAKIPKLLWWQIGAQPEDNEEVVSELNKYSREKIGVEVNIRYIETEEWKNKVAIIILGGEKFDMMFTDYTYYNSPVELKGFADITDVLDTSAPELKEFIPSILWDAVKVKDRIYSVPTYKDSAQTKYWVWDKALVEELNIDYKNISTLQALDTVVRKMKQAKPTEYPVNIDKRGLESVFFGYDTVGGLPIMGVYYTDLDAKVVNILEQTNVFDNLTIVSSWYKDEIINPDVISITNLPKYRMVRESTGYEGANSVWSKKYGYEVASTPVWGPLYSTISILGSVNAISANSKNIEEAIKYLELVNVDPVMRNMLAYGIENKHYTKTSEGTVEYINEAYKPAAYSQATYFNMMAVSPSPANQWDIVKKQNEEAVISPILGFSFNETNVKTELKNCINIYNEYKAELLTGVSEPSVILKKLNADLYNAGLQIVIGEAQKQIDTFLKK